MEFEAHRARLKYAGNENHKLRRGIGSQQSAASERAALLINDLTRHKLETGFSASMHENYSWVKQKQAVFMVLGPSCHEECGTGSMFAFWVAQGQEEGGGKRAGKGMVREET